jgi:hypothetical protein
MPWSSMLREADETLPEHPWQFGHAQWLAVNMLA